MPDAIHTQIATELPAVQEDSARTGLPADIQYMPPGRHTINATRNKEPITIDITADQSAADSLNNWLQDRLQSAAAGTDDRPFFDFNHEDREAAAWPTEFYWAGDDPITGGIRAKVEWTGAGAKAIHERTFRRFSPTFIPDADGKVIASETNMGGLVNRAAFKTIQPLFAKDSHNAEAVAANWSDEARAASLKVRRQRAAGRAAFEQASRGRQERIARNDRRPGESQTARDTRVARERTREDTNRARNRQILRRDSSPRPNANNNSDSVNRQTPLPVKRGHHSTTQQSTDSDIQRQADIWTKRWNTARDRLNRQVGIRPVRSKAHSIKANWSDEARAASLKVRRENARRRAMERLRLAGDLAMAVPLGVGDWWKGEMDDARQRRADRRDRDLKMAQARQDQEIRRVYFPEGGWQQRDLDYFGYPKSLDDNRLLSDETREKIAPFLGTKLTPMPPRIRDRANELFGTPQPPPLIQPRERQAYADKIWEMSDWAENYDTARSKNETTLPEPPAWAVEQFRARNPDQLRSNDPALDSQVLKDNLLNDYYRHISPERESELRLWAIRNQRQSMMTRK